MAIELFAPASRIRRYPIGSLLVGAALSFLARPSHAAPDQPLPPVIVTGDPAAPALLIPGTGLCSSTAVSMDPSTDFPQSTFMYQQGINTFIEKHVADRSTSVMKTIFDLSNNNMSGLKLSYGDFKNSMMPSCPEGGCDFTYNDTTTAFATRFRGFFNVTPALVNRPLHVGFYTDDAVSLVVFDKTQTQYVVVNRPPVLGFATWRSTNSIMFVKPGLYPIEILYAEIGEDAALEMSLLDDANFKDVEIGAKMMGGMSLSALGFKLLDVPNFFETLSGIKPFDDPTQCAQCNRQFANLPGNGGCGSGYYCNDAALCAPCDTALYCGPTCSPCGGDTPFCVNLNGQNKCGQCRMDTDCHKGTKCDLVKHICQRCQVPTDCDQGQTCDHNECVACSTKESCAGVSCNCCPGANVKCAPLNPNEKPSCVECTADADCKAPRKCDTVNGRCVAMVPLHNTPAACGDKAIACPPERPICLDGQVCVVCRADFHCASGQFCLSGECVPCASDRHCGARCSACTGETPFCDTDGTTAHSLCVRCREDADCVGGKCDRVKHQCDKTCTMTCAPGTYCDGTRCVACYSNAHCPCGGSCDLVSGTCSPACADSGDCLGTDHCTLIDKVCKAGRRKPGTDTSGGPCCSVSGLGAATERGDGHESSRRPAPIELGVFGLMGTLLLVGLRRRSRR